MPVASTFPEAQLIENEECFIGALQHMEPRDVLDISQYVEKADFMVIQNQVIFQAICRVAEDGYKPDPALIQRCISRHIGADKAVEAGLRAFDMFRKTFYIRNVWGYLIGMINERLRRDLTGHYGRAAGLEESTESLFIRTGQSWEELSRLHKRIGQLEQERLKRQEGREENERRLSS